MAIPSYATPVDDDSSTTWKPPSYATLAQEQETAAPQEGFLGKALDVIAPGVGTLASTLSQNPKMIAPALSTVARSIPNAAANTFAGLTSMASPAFGSILGGLAQQVPTPSPQASQALSLAANVGLAAPGLEAIPELGALGGAGIKAALSKFSDITGRSANKKANDFIQNLLGENSFSNSHLPVLNEIRNNYSAAQNASNSQYSNILKQAADQGYTGTKQFPGISVATGEKTIVPNNFQNEVTGIDLAPYSKDIQKLLKPFSEKINNNMSFKDAHELQSELGTQGAKLRTSADGSDRYLGGELLGLRDTLKNDITGSLLANNDTGLAQQYQEASNFFKNNVAPYRENSTIRNVVLKKGSQEVNPATIGNVLKKDDGSILPIVNQLSPESKNLLLANQLKTATQELPGKGSQLERQTDAEKLINAYGKLDNKGFSDLRTPEANQVIASLLRDVSRKSIADKLKTFGGYGLAAATGALGVGGAYHFGKELF